MLTLSKGCLRVYRRPELSMPNPASTTLCRHRRKAIREGRKSLTLALYLQGGHSQDPLSFVCLLLSVQNSLCNQPRYNASQYQLWRGDSNDSQVEN